MSSRFNGIVLLLSGCVVAVVCCIVIVGRPSPDDVNLSSMGVPGSTATPGSTGPGWATPGSTATTGLALHSDFGLE